MMRTERVIALKNTYKEALHCMLKLHVDAPLNRSIRIQFPASPSAAGKIHSNSIEIDFSRFVVYIIKFVSLVCTNIL